MEYLSAHYNEYWLIGVCLLSMLSIGLSDWTDRF